MAAGTWSSWLPYMSEGSNECMEATQLPFFLDTVQNPSQEMVPPTVAEPSHLNQYSEDSPLQTFQSLSSSQH